MIASAPPVTPSEQTMVPAEDTIAAPITPPRPTSAVEPTPDAGGLDGDHDDSQACPGQWRGAAALALAPLAIDRLDRPPSLPLSAVPHHPDAGIRGGLKLGLQGLVGASVAVADDDEMGHQITR